MEYATIPPGEVGEGETRNETPIMEDGKDENANSLADQDVRKGF
jgi:hypothetical protein